MVNNTEKAVDSTIMERAIQLQEKFYQAIECLPKDASIKQLHAELDFYSKAFDNLTNELLGISEMKPIITELTEYRSERMDSTQISIDNSLLNYVQDNTDTLIRKDLIKQCHVKGVECLICERPIIGLGLMDWSDCGTNAVCFNCIDKKEHYIGGGVYFTKFA